MQLEKVISAREKEKRKRNHENGGREGLRGFWFVHSLVQTFDTFVQPLDGESSQSIGLPE